MAHGVSYLLSAGAVRAIGGTEPKPAATRAHGLRPGELLEGWRYVLTHPALRPLFFNTVLVNGLIMAVAPVLAVLMLGDLGFAPWQYGLAFVGPGSTRPRTTGSPARFPRGRSPATPPSRP